MRLPKGLLAVILAAGAWALTSPVALAGGWATTLLDPLPMLPILGNPLADWLQPFLKPLVDLGYAPGLLPGLNPLSIAGYVGQGATAGITNPLVAGLPPLVSNSLASGF